MALIEADEDRAHPLAQLQDLVLGGGAAQRQVPGDAGLVDDPGVDRHLEALVPDPG